MRTWSCYSFPLFVTLSMECTYAMVFLLSLVQACKIGFSGPNCSQPCRHPNYGYLCQKQCNCSNDLCNHISGCGKNQQECEDGFYDYDCYSPCRYPSYGKNCQEFCNCSISNCNHIKGCQGNPSILGSNTLLQIHPVFIITGSSVLLFLLVLLVSVILIKKYRSNRTNNSNQDINFDSEFSSFDNDNETMDQRTSVRYCDNSAVIGNCKLETYENIHL
ncbi:uncharacterized protein LOC144627100 [Crassostrea virginica]